MANLSFPAPNGKQKSPDNETQVNLGELTEFATDKAVSAIEQGLSLADVMGWPPEELEALYALGHRHYVQGDYAQAETLFAFLARLKALDARILKALGAARKMQSKYESAVKAYSLAAVADLEDPEPSFYAAECLFHMHEFQRARAALESAKTQAEDKADTAMCTRIDAMLEFVAQKTAAKH